jgi:hypothetical protein
MGIGESIMALSNLALQGCLAYFILARGLHRQFRWFFVYTIYALVAEIVRIALRHYDYEEAYFYVYWVTEALYTVLAFLAIHQVFRWVFRNFYKIRGFGMLLPVVTILALVIVTLRLRQPHTVETYWIVSIIISSEIAVSFLQVGIVALFFFLIRFFHLGWRQHAFGIALGFGIAAAGSLVAFLLRSEFGTKFDPIVRITAPVTYIIAVIAWLATFVSRLPSQPSQSWGSALTPEEMVLELRRYTQVAKNILGK